MGEKLPSTERASQHVSEVQTDNLAQLQKLRETIDGIDSSKNSSTFVSELSRYAEGGSHRAFLLSEGDEAIGYIEVDLDDDYLPKGADAEKGVALQNFAHIARVGVVLPHRGRGVGHMLLTHAEQWAREQGATAVWLDYLSDDTALEHFYTTAGYTVFDEFHDETKNRPRRIVLHDL